jgi:hypothetical protein
MWKPPVSKVVEIAPAAASTDDISLFRGGPFYRAQAFIHLIEPGRWNLGRRVAFILAISWLPLVIVTALYVPDELGAILKSNLVNTRIAIAIPVLLVGQFLMDSRFCAIITHVRKTKLLEGEDRRKLEGVIAILRRLSNSVFPELIIVALVVAELALLWHSKVAAGPAWAVHRSGSVLKLTPAGWYYGLVSVPIYQFLLALNLWKWFLWSFFLFKLSRMRLTLVGTHPDAHGGLGFLGLSPIGFAPIAFALAAAIGGEWRNQILNYGARLANFKLPAVILFILLFTVALAPLGFFVHKLSVVRQRAMLEYGALAQTHVIGFHEKWIAESEGRGEAQLTGYDVGALADLTISYGHIRRMRPFPADLGTMIGLALTIAVPLFPVVLAEIPFSVILKGLIEAVKASPI